MKSYEYHQPDQPMIGFRRDLNSFVQWAARRKAQRIEQVMRASVDKWLCPGVSKYVTKPDAETGEMLHLLMQATGITFTIIYPPYPKPSYLSVRRGAEVLETTLID